MTPVETTGPAIRGGATAARSKGRTLHFAEGPVWQPHQHGWRQLYGDFHKAGVSIEWHEFDLAEDFEWSRGFYPESLELCLNLAGHGSIRHRPGATGALALDLEPLTGGFYLPGPRDLEAWRRGGEAQRFVTIEFARGFLRQHLSACDGALHPLVDGFLRNESRGVGIGEFARLSTEQELLAAQLRHPPGFQAARQLWYQSKVLQLMAEFFFTRRGDDELFCDRQKRVARERVDKVVALLRSHLAEPPSLEEIGRKVGCSPFHLSRTFSAEMGLTIPQFLRKLRMERAAELLRSGRCNVTEAALEVGYSSLSHFSQAFCHIIGCCPGLYPLKREQAPGKEPRSAVPRPVDEGQGEISPNTFPHCAP